MSSENLVEKLFVLLGTRGERLFLVLETSAGSDKFFVWFIDFSTRMRRIGNYPFQSLTDFAVFMILLKITQHLSLYQQNWDLFLNHNSRKLRKFNFIEKYWFNWVYWKGKYCFEFDEIKMRSLSSKLFLIYKTNYCVLIFPCKIISA